MNTNDKIIEVESIKKIYKVTDVFQIVKGEKLSVGIENATFHVNKGEIFAVIGVNGAGKTTIMKSILGLIKPDSGTIKVFGKEKMDKNDYYSIGYLPEISYYPKEVTLKTLINYYADLYNMESKNRKKVIPEILEVLKLYVREGDRLEKFSKGMLQRVGIAQAIMNNPKLLFLDEPMTGLDPIGRKMISDIIKKMKDNGTTIILNTHILSDVEKMADRIVVVDKGIVKATINYREFVKDKSSFRITVDKKLEKAHTGEDGKYYINAHEYDIGSVLKDIYDKGANVIAVDKEELTLERFFLDQLS